MNIKGSEHFQKLIIVTDDSKKDEHERKLINNNRTKMIQSKYCVSISRIRRNLICNVYLYTSIADKYNFVS